MHLRAGIEKRANGPLLPKRSKMSFKLIFNSGTGTNARTPKVHPDVGEQHSQRVPEEPFARPSLVPYTKVRAVVNGCSSEKIGAGSRPR